MIQKVSDINNFFSDYVINHNKKYEFYTNEVIFENEFETIGIYFDNTPSIDIEFYIKHNFSHITEMIIETISDVRNLPCKYYNNNQMHMVQRRLNMIIARNPHLINAVDRFVSHHLI